MMWMLTVAEETRGQADRVEMVGVRVTVAAAAAEARYGSGPVGVTGCRA